MPLLMGLIRPAVCGVVTLAALTAAATPAWAQKTVIVVRHAERVDSSTDSPLSPAGQQRAQTLARTVSRAEVTAIFVTQFQRTQMTAAPLAAQLKLTPTVVTANTTALVERIRRDHGNDVVLIVGHSNTVPEILTQFGVTEPVTIQDDEFDALFILVPRGQAGPSIVRLRY
jgi:broad specificity phosphatase PhoE